LRDRFAPFFTVYATMFKFTGPGSITTCDGISRRDFLQAGTLGALGLSLPMLNALRAQGAVDKSKDDSSCIMIFNLGAPSQIDTWDPSRGAARSPRAVQGHQNEQSGHPAHGDLPKMAKLADKFSSFAASITPPRPCMTLAIR